MKIFFKIFFVGKDLSLIRFVLYDFSTIVGFSQFEVWAELVGPTLRFYFKVHLPVDQPTFNSDLLHYYEKEVREKGLVVLKDVFSNKHLDELTGDFDNNWDEVQEK